MAWLRLGTQPNGNIHISMKPDISEFSYGFALTNELIDRYRLRSAGAPEFPSPYKEGKSGGYDVKLVGIPVFLQFKVSDCMVKRKKRGQRKKWGEATLPFSTARSSASVPLSCHHSTDKWRPALPCVEPGNGGPSVRHVVRLQYRRMRRTGLRQSHLNL